MCCSRAAWRSRTASGNARASGFGANPPQVNYYQLVIRREAAIAAAAAAAHQATAAMLTAEIATMTTQYDQHGRGRLAGRRCGG